MSTELAKWIFYKSAKIFGLVSVLLTSLVCLFFLHSEVRACFQAAITCSKLIIETLEQGVKYVQS